MRASTIAYQSCNKFWPFTTFRVVLDLACCCFCSLSQRCYSLILQLLNSAYRPCGHAVVYQR